MPSLTTLPAEIRTTIVKLLAPDVPLLGYSECPPGRPSPEEENQRAALVSLAGTCKSLQTLVTPELYCCPIVKEDKWPEFLRSLVENRSLASYVQTLFFYGLNSEAPKSPPVELYTTFNEIMKDRYGSSSDAPKPFEIPAEGEEREVVVGADEFEARTKKRYASIALALVPNVQRLIVPNIWFKFPKLGENGLPCLKELSYEHDDTEMGVSLSSMNEIITAAPVLETFTVMMASDAEDLATSGSLKTVRLSNSSLNSVCFRTLVGALPNLESFQYMAGGPTVSDVSDATAGQIIAQLSKRRSTLKHLCLDVSEATYMELGLEDDEGEDEDEDEESGRSYNFDLSQLDQLETVSVMGAFAKWKVAGEDIPEDAVVDMLPKSVQRIAIYAHNGETEAAMMHLAEVASEEFPELKQVRFDDATTGKDGYPAAKAMFEEAGIKCSAASINDIDFPEHDESLSRW